MKYKKLNIIYNMDFSHIEVIKKIGAGIKGTTYLIKSHGNNYAMKIQHILEKDKKRDFNNELWREIDLYNYIGRMKLKNRCFFTQLYHYDFINDCTHKQEREWNFDPNSSLGKELAELDKSPWCLRFFLDYHGDTTLRNYMETHKLTLKQKYSMLLQICKIIMLLYEGGYMHKDLHANNIMVSPTTKEYFTLMGKKVPYYGIQLSAIDYGEVMHEKFGIPYMRMKRHFIENKYMYLMTEMFKDCLFQLHIMNYEKMIADCRKKKKGLPWESDSYYLHKGLKQIFINYPEFVEKYKETYLKSFPKARELFDYVQSQIRTSNQYIFPMIVNKENDLYFMHVLDRLEMRFALEHPEDYKKIMGWCSEPEFILPKKDVIEIMELNTPNKIVKYL